MYQEQRGLSGKDDLWIRWAAQGGESDAWSRPTDCVDPTIW
jgi:hypothetical protein